MSNPSTMTYPQRALQLWSLLSLAALTRTIPSYEEAANLTGLPNNCAHALGHIYYYCAQRDLPLLTSLVVDKHTGRRNADVLYDSIEIPTEHRRCFAYDWLKHGVPSLQELEDAYEIGKAAAA